MKEIPLTQGKVALVDDEDYEPLLKWKWMYHNKGYAFVIVKTTENKRIGLFMHHLIIPGGKVDHIDQDGLNNQKYNLRKTTASLNGLNNKASGACFHQKNQKWVSHIRVNGKLTYLGSFIKKEDAERRYQEEKQKLFESAYSTK